MNRKHPQPGPTLKRLDDGISRLLRAISPERAYRRAQFAAAYDALDRHRTRKKRSLLGGVADEHLTVSALDELREIHREYMRNNPLIEGLLLTEVDEIIGADYPMVQALTDDEGWNKAAEQNYKEQMVDRPCDITGRFNVNQQIGLAYLSYRRDGDYFMLFLDDYLQGIEGDWVGTPYKYSQPETYSVTNGVAISHQTRRVLGYYVGRPLADNLYIDEKNYTLYRTDRIAHVFNPQRITQSRGEPCLKASVDWIDKLSRYIDCELVAANVNACFTMFVARKDPSPPESYTGGVHPSGEDDDGNRMEKMESGTILYGQPGEDARGIGMNRPGDMFDPYVMRMLSFITRPLAIPLMMVLGDYTRATFMNARFAYQSAQSRWKREQSWVIRPLVSRIWRWHIEKQIRQGNLPARDDQYRHRVQLRCWPYVDPYKEALAEKLQMENGTATRREFIEARGKDYDEVLAQRRTEKDDNADFQPAIEEQTDDDE